MSAVGEHRAELVGDGGRGDACEDRADWAVEVQQECTGVVEHVSDQVLVMYRGEIVEHGTAVQIFAAPRHPYTQALLAAVPRLGSMRGSDEPARFPVPDSTLSSELVAAPLRPPASGTPLLKVRGLKTRFAVRGGFFGRVRRQVHAVEQISFDLAAGETLALVGESGCGKSVTALSLMRLVAPPESTRRERPR